MILKTNYFGQTTLQIMIDAKYSFDFNIPTFIDAYLNMVDDLKVAEDLAILSVYGDARTNPTENISKLIPLIKNKQEMLDILNNIKLHLNTVQKQKSALDDAITNGDKNTVIEILNQNKKIIKELMLIGNDNGQTALHIAAECNQTKIVQVLLESVKEYPRILEEMVTKINICDQETALHLAAKCSHESTVMTLLQFIQIHQQDTLKRLLLKPSANDASVICGTKYNKINQLILDWIRENLDEHVFIESIQKAHSFEFIDGHCFYLDHKDVLKLSKNMQKLKSLSKYNDILKDLVLQTDRKGYTILLNIIENYENIFDKFDVNLDFSQNINDITLTNLAKLSVYGDGRIDPERKVNQLLDE